ncbi:MAG: hypothetical protein WAN22_29385, partial [Solirubrobacteraceae bacterium]
VLSGPRPRPDRRLAPPGLLVEPGAATRAARSDPDLTHFIGQNRSFFALTVPGPEMIVTALAASAVSIGALALSGYSLRVAPADSA